MAKSNVWDQAQDESGALVTFTNIGDSLVAILIERSEKPDKYNPGATTGFYEAVSAEGKSNFFPTASLDDQLKRAVGKIVRIELVELKPSPKGNPIKVFEVKSLQNTQENRNACGLDAFGGAETSKSEGGEDEEEI